MRTLCDACESAAAIVFCAADEAALCRACDEKFPGDKPINLEDPCPHANVSNEISNRHSQPPTHKVTVEDNKQNHHRLSPVQEANDDGHAETDTKMIDLNMKPQRVHGQAANNQDL